MLRDRALSTLLLSPYKHNFKQLVKYAEFCLNEPIPKKSGTKKRSKQSSLSLNFPISKKICCSLRIYLLQDSMRRLSYREAKCWGNVLRDFF